MTHATALYKNSPKYVKPGKKPLPGRELKYAVRAPEKMIATILITSIIFEEQTGFWIIVLKMR